MKIILAQGNFGIEYERTRHNIGFKFADFFAQKYSAVFYEKSKFKAEVAELNINGEKILIVKPKTFYNETGFSARTICDFYKVDHKKDLLVICDDLSLPFGTIRTRQKGSSAGNNGLKSLISHLDDEFARIKIGICNEKLSIIGSTNFVLAKFSSEESRKIDQIFSVCEDFTNSFINDNFSNHKCSIDL